MYLDVLYLLCTRLNSFRHRNLRLLHIHSSMATTQSSQMLAHVTANGHIIPMVVDLTTTEQFSQPQNCGLFLVQKLFFICVCFVVLGVKLRIWGIQHTLVIHLHPAYHSFSRVLFSIPVSLQEHVHVCEGLKWTLVVFLDCSSLYLSAQGHLLNVAVSNSTSQLAPGTPSSVLPPEYWDSKWLLQPT